MFERILVFRIGSLGDTVVALPAFWRTRNAFPNASISLLSNVDSQNADYILAQEVLPDSGLFDRFISYPSNTSGRRLIRDHFELAKLLRKGRFDAVVYLMPRTRSRLQIYRDFLFFRTIGIRKVLGFKHLLGNLLEVHSPHPSPIVDREGDFLTDCLNADEFPETNVPDRYDPGLTQEEVSFAKLWITGQVPLRHTYDHIIAVAPCGKWTSKTWPSNNFYEVVKALIDERNVFPIIFGGSVDRQTGDTLIERWGRGANAAGSLSVRQAAAALQSCDLYLGNDTGTMHLAASVSTPCIAVFSSIDWAGRWYPFGNNHSVFRTEIECEGCLLEVCPIDNLCMKMIEVNRVISSSLKLLDSLDKPSSAKVL